MPATTNNNDTTSSSAKPPSMLWQTWNKMAAKMVKNKNNTATTGTDAEAAKQPAYDPTFTAQVIAATGPEAHPRMAEIMPSLLRHLHDFAREVNLTAAEWATAVDFVSSSLRRFPWPCFFVVTRCCHQVITRFSRAVTDL